MEEEPFARAFQLREADLHGDKWWLELDDSIEAQYLDRGWYKYIRSSYGKFCCSKCKHYWSSTRVTLMFHFHLDEMSHFGFVKVRRFRQKCRKCKQAKMEEPSFSLDNTDVMVEKLIEKIRKRCYREDLDDAYKHLHFEGKVNGPHESDYCEACQRGICNMTPENTDPH